MPSSTVNWGSAETWQRLVAAIVATGIKIDLHEVATMYGTTYDTIQNRYRKIRKEAEKLKKEVESGERGGVATPKKGGCARAATATPTPRKGKGKGTKDALSTVTNGRVTKPSSKKKSAVKPEPKEVGVEREDDVFGDIDFGADLGDAEMDEEDFFK